MSYQVKGTNNRRLRPFPSLVLKTGHYLLQILLLGLAVHLILPQITTFESSLQVVSSMNTYILTLAFAAEVLSYIGSGYLLKECVMITRQHLSVLSGALLTLAAASIGMIAGGTLGNAAAIYRWTRIRGINVDGAVMAGTLPSLFINTVLIMASFFGLIHLLTVHELSETQTFAFTSILCIIGMLILFFYWSNKHRSRFISMVCSVSARWSELRGTTYNANVTSENINRSLDSFDKVKQGGWKGPALGSLLSVMFDMTALYFVFMAVGHQVSVSILLIGYGLPLLIGKAAFLIPGGIGIVEGTMAAIYTGMGIPASISVVVILTYRMISFWIPTTLGFPVAMYLQRPESIRK